MAAAATTTTVISRSVLQFNTVKSLTRSLSKTDVTEEEKDTTAAQWKLTNYDRSTTVENANDPLAEAQRLQVLLSYDILNSKKEASLDEITHMAKEAFDVPMAAITCMDYGRVCFKSSLGLPPNTLEIPRDGSFCAHTIRRRLDCGILVVEDATMDQRFAQSTLVQDHGIRFYAGAPIKSPEGAILGTLCILDTKPRPKGSMTIFLQQHLQTMADCAMANIMML